MNKSIYILHLSDLHIDPNQEGETKVIFDNLCKKLEGFKQEKGKGFDLLIISGDLVNQGAGNYKTVQNRINDILSACDLSTDKVFIVPGNHDIVWSQCPNTNHYRLLIQSLKNNPSEFEKIEENDKKLLRPGFNAYNDFCKHFSLLQQSKFDLPGFKQAELVISDIPIRLCGLNSAIISGRFDEDKNDRIIGKKILWQMLSGNDYLNLVVSHYPLSWINPSERKEVIERLQQAGAIFFNGHIHEPDANVIGLQPTSQLLVLGVGSLYGQKWIGRNHCQVLELNPNFPTPFIHEYFWFSNYGWRRLEPLEVSWPKWDKWRKFCKIPSLPQPNTLVNIGACGLIDIGNSRQEHQRIAYYQQAIETASEGSDLIVIGRSLIDFSLLFKQIETAINERNLHVKIGLLDKNTCYENRPESGSPVKSWIETPISSDWAIRDVPISMNRLKQIIVSPNTGSLEIYGLPFYTSHSFICYTNKIDNQRHCLEELGMAVDKTQRPFIELVISENSYGDTLEKLYRSFMIQDRLLLSDNGAKIEKDTTKRSKIIIPKIEKNGLVDLSVGQNSIDWIDYAQQIDKIIDQTPINGELFIIGRSLISWVIHLKYLNLAKAIVFKKIKCTFVMVDATDDKLKSLVQPDYSEKDVRLAWNIFHTEMVQFIDQLMQERHYTSSEVGMFELYGIPAYLPETFAIYTREDGVKYCSLEIGIGVVPENRPILYFQNISNKDFFVNLEQIYKGIIVGRMPAIKIPR